MCEYTCYITCFKDFDFGVTNFIFSVSFVVYSFIVCFVVTAVGVIIIANNEQQDIITLITFIVTLVLTKMITAIEKAITLSIITFFLLLLLI